MVRTERQLYTNYRNKEAKVRSLHSHALVARTRRPPFRLAWRRVAGAPELNLAVAFLVDGLVFGALYLLGTLQRNKILFWTSRLTGASRCGACPA